MGKAERPAGEQSAGPGPMSLRAGSEDAPGTRHPAGENYAASLAEKAQMSDEHQDFSGHSGEPDDGSNIQSTASRVGVTSPQGGRRPGGRSRPDSQAAVLAGCPHPTAPITESPDGTHKAKPGQEGLGQGATGRQGILSQTRRAATCGVPPLSVSPDRDPATTGLQEGCRAGPGQPDRCLQAAWEPA